MLQQGHRAFDDYVKDFRHWSSDTNWNALALHFQLWLGLSEALKDELGGVALCGCCQRFPVFLAQLLWVQLYQLLMPLNQCNLAYFILHYLPRNANVVCKIMSVYIAEKWATMYGSVL